MTPARTDLWHPLDDNGHGDRMPARNVLVWLWRPMPGGSGYWALGRFTGSGWCYPAGALMTAWTPTHWTPVPEPVGPPPDTEGSGT